MEIADFAYFGRVATVDTLEAPTRPSTRKTPLISIVSQVASLNPRDSAGTTVGSAVRSSPISAPADSRVLSASACAASSSASAVLDRPPASIAAAMAVPRAAPSWRTVL